MGTPDFALGTLDAIEAAGHEIVLVVSQPDRPKGRGNAMQFPPVKEWRILYHTLAEGTQSARRKLWYNLSVNPLSRSKT